MRTKAIFAALVASVAVAACSKSNEGDTAAANNAAPAEPVQALLKSVDGATCAHPEVIKVATELLRKMPDGASLEERLLVDKLKADADAYPAVDIKLDRITLADAKSETQSVDCSAVATLSYQDASLNEGLQRPEKSVSYSVSPSAENPSDFVVQTSDSVVGELYQLGSFGAIKIAQRKRAEDLRANGPAFDCMGPNTGPINGAICEDRDLSKLDREVSGALMSKVEAGTLTKDAADRTYADWFNNKHYGCDFPSSTWKGCMVEKYNAKLAELR